jgi:hypothetical protein
VNTTREETAKRLAEVIGQLGVTTEQAIRNSQSANTLRPAATRYDTALPPTPRINRVPLPSEEREK